MKIIKKTEFREVEIRGRWIGWVGHFSSKSSLGDISAKKILILVFQNTKGICLVNYFQTGKTINWDCRLDLLDTKIRRKYSSFKRKKIIFHQAQKTIAQISELKYEL